ncbi:MAG: hemerythrin domain-containing protein [Chloroflexota bacterium]
MDALDTLKEEHRVIDLVLVAWKHAMQKRAKGRTVPPRFFFDSLDFLRVFVENYHCKREEILFKWAQKRGLSGGLIRMLLEGHEEGHRMFISVQNVTQIPSEDQLMLNDFVSAGNAYVEFKEQHIIFERNALYPAFTQMTFFASESELDELTRSMDMVVKNIDADVLVKGLSKYYLSMAETLEALEKKMKR